MKKAFSMIVSFIMMLVLTGCDKYSSSYKAFGFIHSNKSDSAEMSFNSFEGTIVFKLESSGEGNLKYTAKLESGTAVVYYDNSGDKSELFTIGAGEELDSYGGDIGSGTVYIVVETNGECTNGEFSINLE